MDKMYGADTVNVWIAVSEHFRYSFRSVVSDFTEILTNEFVNIIQNAQISISHFERNILNKSDLFIEEWSQVEVGGRPSAQLGKNCQVHQVALAFV